MSRSQQYLDSLLSGVPLEELAAFESRAAFQQLKERLAGTQDVVGELKVLYRVNNFSELAVQLLWIAQQAEQSPALLEPTAEEQTLVLSLFRNAVGDSIETATEEPLAQSQEVTEQALVQETVIEETYAPEPVVEPPIEQISEPVQEVMPTPEQEQEPTPEPTVEQAPEPEQSQEALGGFGFAEETPQQDTQAADPFGMPSEPGPVATPEADPFNIGSTTEASAETPAEDPFGMGSASEEQSALASTADSTSASNFDFPTDSAQEPTPEPAMDFPSSPAEEPAPPTTASTPAASAGEGSPEMQFATLVEKFSEAISSGAEDRDTVKDQMLSMCAGVLADGSAPEDYKNFCQVLTDFISYIYENQFVDDIRVMNLVSNVPDPVWAWAKTDAASRTGMMSAAYDTLREFKSLFE